MSSANNNSSYNRDKHIDGHEMRLAFLGYGSTTDYEKLPEIDLKEMEGYIDKTLLEDDIDNDGKISWPE
jgi:hypothetical protein